jgi:translation initiation factor 2 alpha subunit (eIF-2alpha)
MQLTSPKTISSMNTTKTKKETSMPEKSTSKDPSAIFEEAIKIFEQVMQSGVKLQKDTTKCWNDMVNDAALPNEWQEKAKKAAADSINLSQTQLKETVKLMENQSKVGLELLQKALDASQTKDLKEAQTKTRELWESCFTTVQDSAKTLIQQNAKALESWQSLMSAAFIK